MLMNGKEVNNLIIDGERFVKVNDELVGKQVKVFKGQKAQFIYTGDINNYTQGDVYRDQKATILQLLYLSSVSSSESDWWVKLVLEIIYGNNVYQKAPCYLQLSSIKIIN